MQIGVASFADTTREAQTGPERARRIRDLIEEIAFADEVGLEVFGVGEHHRPDYAASAPAMILAVAAERTKNIRLTTAVTVLSSDDPVRVFQQFATLDQLSGGRAEIMAGRGSFTESYPLFGYDLNQYDQLFADKLKLLLKLQAGGPITWQGAGRAPIDGIEVWPKPVQEPLPVWIAVGGSVNSVRRAGTLGLPLSLAIIGGGPERFVPLIELYRQSAAEAGHDFTKLPVSINSHTYVADDSRQAADEFWPGYSEVMTRIGGERGWPPMSRNQYEALRSPAGALLVGNSEEVAAKILWEYELFHNDRFLAQLSIGALPHAQAMRAIELLGTKVAPMVRQALAKPVPAGA